MNSTRHLSIEIDIIRLFRIDSSSAICLATADERYGKIYLCGAGGVWLPDETLPPDQAKCLWSRITEIALSTPPILHCPGRRDLDGPLAALVQFLWEKSGKASLLEAHVNSIVMNLVNEILYFRRTPEQAVESFHVLIAKGIGWESRHSEISDTAELLELIGKVKAAIDAETGRRSRKVSMAARRRASKAA